MAKSQRRGKRKAIFWLQKCFYSLIAIAVFGLVYIFQIEPNWFEVVSVDAAIPNLSSAFNWFKIVQISDIHADTSMTPKKLNKIVKSSEKQHPSDKV